jgi:hypothetical protein
MDYLAIATTLAHSQAARLTARETGRQTHWNTWDVPTRRDQTQAACGEVVNLKAISGSPTCPACRQQLALYESRQF